ncbi:MAG: DUF58 domain-containing protein [Planctomycetales bacterium]|nr:DUF58 domain-containing protein [Planctomycetales bacterium]
MGVSRQRPRQVAETPTAARQFEFEVKRLANSLMFGADPSRFVGSGLEYAESRPYEPGDPVKSIDWRITARTGKPFVKQFEAVRQVPIYLVVDTSASMCLTSLTSPSHMTPRETKYAWAVRLAAALARAAQERLSPVGLLGAGSHELHIRPTLSKRVSLQWAHQLRTHDFSQHTRLSRSLETLAAVQKTSSLVLVLSDLQEDGVVGALEHLAVGHEAVTLWLEDPAERQLPARGYFRGREAETGRSFLLSRRTRYSKHESIRSALRDAGLEFLHLPIDEPVIPRLQHFLKHRKSLGHA